MSTHNAHMLIPKELWSETGRIAKCENKNMTELVCEGLKLLIASRNQEKESQHVSDAQTSNSSD